jgi:uncharacterized delta-60 repeat protein
MVRTSIRPVLVLGMAAALTLATAAVAVAAPGDLDTSFGRGGKVVTDVTKRGDGLNAVAIASTGRIVVAGTSKDGARFAIARYRTDGSLDPTFGDHGIAQTNVTDANDILHGVAVQPDGDIVVAGQVGSGPRFVVARYTAGGRLDPTFGGDGMVSTSFEATGGDAAVAVAVLADGKILAAGVAHTNCSCERYAVARYRTNGRLDRTFGTNGRATLHFRSGGEPGAMAVGPDGSIVLVGGNVPDVDKFQVARFTPDGAIDRAFGGGDGKVTTNTGQGEEAATGVAIDRDGSAIVIGYTDLPHEGGETFGPSKFALVRYAADGTLDPSFGTNGRVKTALFDGRLPARRGRRGRQEDRGPRRRRQPVRAREIRDGRQPRPDVRGRRQGHDEPLVRRRRRARGRASGRWPDRGCRDGLGSGPRGLRAGPVPRGLMLAISRRPARRAPGGA